MRNIPKLYWDRSITFDEDMLEKLLYLGKIYDISVNPNIISNAVSDICNKALREFFDVKFKELKLEHYINPGYETNKIRGEQRIKEAIKGKDDLRLLALANGRIKHILKKEIEKIKEEEVKTGKKTKVIIPREVKNIKEWLL